LEYISTSSIITATQRENGLVLFHLIGKVMYNKSRFFFFLSTFGTNSETYPAGKGDPHSRSASAKDIARDRALDRSLKDPPPLPSWSVAEERRPSRVDVQVGHSPQPLFSFSDFCRCCMRPLRSMRPFWVSTFIKIIRNIVQTLNNAAR
jgi:hypothetical protein